MYNGHSFWFASVFHNLKYKLEMQNGQQKQNYEHIAVNKSMGISQLSTAANPMQ